MLAAISIPSSGLVRPITAIISISTSPTGAAGRHIVPSALPATPALSFRIHVRKERNIHAFEKTDDPGDAVAACPFAFTARAAADLELLQDDRIAEFEDFGIGQPGVGHVGVNGAGAVEPGTGA